MADAGTTFGKPLGYQQITTLTSAVGLTVPDGARIVVIQVTGQSVRWRDDGTDPTGTVGMLVLTTDRPFIYTGDLDAITFIQTAASAVLNASYYA